MARIFRLGICFVWASIGCAGSTETSNSQPSPEVAESPARQSELEQAEAPSQEPEVPPQRVRGSVRIVVLGEFPSEWVEASAARLREHFDLQVSVEEPIELPEEAYYPPRRRYRADRILDFLRERYLSDPPSIRIIGLTSVDISTTNGPHPDWGVFGLGELEGRASVVSSFRLRRRARNQEHTQFRITTTVVHEIGHTLVLPHCEEHLCVMRDAEGSIRTVDTSTGDMGTNCRSLMERINPLTVALAEGFDAPHDSQ